MPASQLICMSEVPCVQLSAVPTTKVEHLEAAVRYQVAKAFVGSCVYSKQKNKPETDKTVQPMNHQHDKNLILQEKQERGTQFS